MMDRLDKETEAVAAASDAPLVTSGSAAIYPLPPEYRKPIRYVANGKAIRLTGGRALVLDRLIGAGPAGIDRATTLQWVANLGDTIAALRTAGIAIETRRRKPANYAIACHVEKIGGAQ